MDKFRTVILFKDYFIEFFNKQRQKVKDKIIWTFKLIEITQQIPVEYFKHIEGTDGLYEIRIIQGSDTFRVFCFFDQGKLLCWRMDFKKRHRRHQNLKS